MLFKEETMKIPHSEIREWVIEGLGRVPKVFLLTPASISGKYHAKDERVLGGKVLHTKRVFAVAEILCDGERDILDERERAEILAAVLLHDTQYLITNTRIQNRNHAHRVKPVMEHLMGTQWTERFPQVWRLVECHMGRWSEHPQYRPETLPERIVHMADNVAAKLHFVQEVMISVEEEQLIWKAQKEQLEEGTKKGEVRR